MTVFNNIFLKLSFSPIHNDIVSRSIITNGFGTIDILYLYEKYSNP